MARAGALNTASPVPTILHISDVHFGRPHLPALAAGVADLTRERGPDLVVLSGDLTQRAKPRQFREARAFVDGLAAPVLVVPGNHDVPLYRWWERLFDPFGAYRRHFATELEPVHRGAGLLVLGVNSAHALTRRDGKIRSRRLRAIADALKAAPAGVCKVIVVHHHVIPPPRFGSQRVLTNAVRAMDLFTRHGVELILSGHQHQAYIGNSEEFYPKGRPPVVILHSGTTTSRRGRGGERDKNSCNWIEVAAETLRVSVLRWEAGLGRFAEHSRHWYPRQVRRPYTLEGLTP